MKKIATYLLVAATGALIAGVPAYPKEGNNAPGPANHIAVVKGKYDDVGLVLDNFRIPHDLLEVREMEDPDRLDRYRSLFLPSGADTPLEESLAVYAGRFRYQSVELKQDYHEVEKEKIAQSLRRFVKRGGSVYVSGYSYEYLQMAFGIFEFFDDFPYMGMTSRVEAELKNDLARFSMKNRMALYLDHPGWIALKSAHDAEAIAVGTFETPRGARSGPISVIARRGKGEILYTSYDSTMFSAFRRFNIYRIAGGDLIKSLEEEASKWGRRVTGRIVDAVHSSEYAGMYRVDLMEGPNTIYFLSERDFFQVDILDEDGHLIESRDIFEREQRFTVNSRDGGHCLIRLYPSTTDRFGMYAILSASGRGYIPYFNYILFIAGGMLLAAGLFFGVYRFFFSKGYSGRWRG